MKRFVYVHLRCIVNNLIMISRNPTLNPPGKIYADAHVHIINDLTVVHLFIFNLVPGAV